jgi:hypothetical protein
MKQTNYNKHLNKTEHVSILISNQQSNFVGGGLYFISWAMW